MDMKKATWTTDDNSFSMSMELTKVDKENRLVSGWASLDNEDLQGDVVLAEASERAFKKFRGNIREMHKNEAVGRMVAFKPETYHDPESGESYKGIYVTAYVSKGAPNTWEKVLDGTLSAFSIKGPIRDSEMDFSKSDRTRRIVKDYDLEELSLVDSGGNQYANVVSIQKDVNGNTQVTGMIAETEFDNIFWCDKDRVAKISSEDSEVCFDGHKMVRAGWTERDGRSDLEKINTVLNDYLKKGKPEQESPAENEGGVEVADTKNDEKVEAGSPVANEIDATEQGKAETEVAAADVEEVEAPEEKEAADVPEVDADVDLEKSLSDLEAKIKDGVEKNESSITELMKSIDEKFTVQGENFEKKFAELAERQADLSKSLESVVEIVEKMVKSVSGLENETALKKSSDLGGLQEDGTLEKSASGVWSGAFL
jgi:hypothetical protein